MSITQLSAQAFKQQSEGATVIDVREPAEYRSGSIEGSVSIPLGQITGQQLSSHHSNQDEPVYIYCLKGVRGQKACEKLKAEHPSLNLFNLEGGISAWKDSGFSVTASNSKVLPLDRQVQITIGSAVLAGVLLSQSVNENFVWLSGFFGAGLLFAGISGFCGLARVMALMPWNK